MGINDAHSDSPYSLNKIILDLSPVFFGLVEAGTDNLDPDYFPGSPKGIALEPPIAASNSL